MASKTTASELNEDVQQAAIARAIARAKGDKSDTNWAIAYRGVAAHHNQDMPAFKRLVDDYARKNQGKIVAEVLRHTGIQL